MEEVNAENFRVSGLISQFTVYERERFMQPPERMSAINPEIWGEIGQISVMREGVSQSFPERIL